MLQVVATNAERAGSFGADPVRYDRARPSYSQEMIQFLLRDQPTMVLDVGCGTGISSGPFLDAGLLVWGVEHDPRMAAVARSHGVEVHVGRFEEWEPASDSQFDLVISGQAWHWIDPVAGPMKAASLLGPGGRLAIFWVSYAHCEQVVEVFANVYGERAPTLLADSFPLGGDPARSALLASSYSSSLRDAGAFSMPEAMAFVGARSYTVESWLDELPTHSDHQLLPDDEREQLLEALRRELLQSVGPTFNVEMSTHLVTATRLE